MTSTPSPAAEREYTLGTDQIEAQRLAFQHQVWAGPTTAAWERAGFAPGDRLLDVGCGPGYGTLDLARLVGPEGSVLGVDLSRRFLDQLEARARAGHVHNVRTQLSAAESMALEPASFDGAFARWVLCFSPDPGAVVARVAAALRPGGRLVVLDYVHYGAFSVFPRSAVLDEVIRVITDRFRDGAAEPDVGGVLPRLMLEAGLEVDEVHPLVRIGRPNTALWAWPDTFFRSYLPRLVELGGLSEDDHRAFMADWEARSKDPAAFLLAPPMVSVIGRRAG